MDTLSREEKIELIGGLENGYSQVEELIAGASTEELRFVPPLREAWSIDDFFVHFLDADLSLAFRTRTAIAEPGKEVPVWDEEAWHEKLRYDAMDGLACLALAKGLRAFVASSLRSAVDAEWSDLYIEHPVRGRVELDALIAMYEQHIAFHLPLIKRNRRAWSERGTLL
jgi:hypothetical protein